MMRKGTRKRVIRFTEATLLLLLFGGEGVNPIETGMNGSQIEVNGMGSFYIISKIFKAS
jgi:hypothetical protein